MRRMILALALCSLSIQSIHAEEKKVATALMVTPFAVATGQAVKFDVRGLNLGDATAVRLVAGDKSLDAIIKTKGAIDVPNGYDAKEVGNTRLEIEATFPADFPVGPATITIATPSGEAKQTLLVHRPEELVPEKEPNDGFRQAQPLAIDRVVVGSIQQPKDVDVYELTATAGQKLDVAVIAARHGSSLDAILTVFGSQGQILGQQDDPESGRDPQVTFTTTVAGKYFVVVQDAHDRGGLHPYVLTVRPSK